MAIYFLFYSDKTETNEDRVKSFESVYKNNAWGSGESGSGGGSELSATVEMINILNQVIELLKKRLGKDKIR